MWQKPLKKTVFTVRVDNFAPEICDLTYPFIKRWANKIGADFHEITERKFPHLPPPCEKLQIYRLAQEMENDYNIYIDADAFVHPEAPDFTLLLDKDTVMHHGKDMAAIRWKYDRYFLRDGRHIGSANWFTIASDWCIELWKPIDDLSVEEILANINPTPKELISGVDAPHLIDDYTLSRNIAKYGFKTTTVLEKHPLIGLTQMQCFFWHEYQIPREKKAKKLKEIASAFTQIFPVGTFPIAQPIPEAVPADGVKPPEPIHAQIEQWTTTDGKGTYWAPKGDKSLPSVVEEQRLNYYGEIKEGDVVIDGGGYIGVFARKCIQAGASMVVSIEPQPVVAACFELNLQEEIKRGQVTLGKFGLWDSDSRMDLSVDEHWMSQSSLLITRCGGKTINVPVATVDKTVEHLKLDRVDFIKMDIEGAEVPALVGAAITIRRFHPRLAIATEHMVGDTKAIIETLNDICPDYQCVENKEAMVLHCTPTMVAVPIA